MSLLNQVLLDLDAREPGPARPALHTAPAAASARAADDDDPRWRPPWRRALVLGLLALMLASAAWVWHLSRQPAAHGEPPARQLPLPSPAAPTAATRPVPAAPAISAPPATPAPSPAARQAPVVAREDPQATPPAPPAGPATPAETAARVAGGQADADFLPLRNVTLPSPVADRPAGRPQPPIATSPAVRTAPASATKSIRPAAVDPLARARRAIAGGALAEAESLLRQRLAGRPDDRVARELLIGMLVRGDRVDDALRQLDAGLAHHPDNGNLVLIKARLLAQAGERDAAIALLQAAARLPAIRAPRLQMLGALYQQSGDYPAAAEHYRALLAVRPDSAAGWVGLAITRDARGEPDAAQAYRRALRIGGLPATAAAYARRRLAELE